METSLKCFYQEYAKWLYVHFKVPINKNRVQLMTSWSYIVVLPGVRFGHGVYFARDASYSMGYANRQLSGSQPKMYMAKVLVGDYTKGAKGMKAPPLKNDSNNPGLRYDSVVDHLNNPSMYVIFQDNQYYPEYLLTMR